MTPEDRDWWAVHLYHLLAIVPGIPLAILLLFVLFGLQVAFGLTSGPGLGFETMTPLGAFVAYLPILVVSLVIVVTWVLGFAAYYFDARQLRRTDASYEPLWQAYTLSHVLFGPLSAGVYLVQRYRNTDMSIRG